MHTCVVMWKVVLFWFVLQLNMDVQQYFINSVAVASHPVCPPLNRKTSNSGSDCRFLWPAGGKVIVWVWGGNKMQSRITCTLSIHVSCLPSLPFVPFLSPLLQDHLCHFASGLSFTSHTCQNPHTHTPSVIFHASSVHLSVTLTLPMPAVFVLFSAQNTSHTLVFCNDDVMTEKCYLVLSGEEGWGKAWKGGNKLRQWLLVVHKNCFLENNLALFFPPSN